MEYDQRYDALKIHDTMKELDNAKCNPDLLLVTYI